MAKKKKSQKKHQFKYAEPTAASGSLAPAAQPAALAAKSAPAKADGRQMAPANYDIDNLELIKADIRKVLFLAGGFIVFQLGLWFLVEHTVLGPAIYHLIKV